MERSDNILVESHSVLRNMPTLGEIHEKRLNNFKKYVCSTIKDEKFKQILTDFSNMPTPVFFSKIKEVILPRKDDLQRFISQMCTESTIDINQFDDNVILKIICFLEFFCKATEEYY
jgi:hypothetical protein